jgi:diaminopimelate decarboxylase
MNKDVTYSPKDKIVEATGRFETPFFLYSEARIRENCRTFKNAFTKYFPDFEALFAVKANPNPEVLKIIMDEGYSFDMSSEAEVWIVDKIGGEGMHTGNYIPASEIKMVLDTGMTLNLDDVSLLDFVEEVPETLSFRVNPGVTQGSMKSLLTAGPEAKYGVPFEKAAEAYQRAADMGVKKFGIHMMSGSNVCEEEYFPAVVEKLLEIVAGLPVEIEFMNIGGGFGVPYKEDEKSLDMEKVAEGVKKVFDEQCKKHQIKTPRLMAEPGRFITADAGWLIGEVVTIKDSYKKFVGITASANDMPRPSIYNAYHYISVIQKNPSPETETVSVVGSICENNDQFARDRKLPICKRGDTVVIHNCGAHAFAMGHNYNGKLRHAEYLLKESGDMQMIRRAETIEDLYKTTNL